ncbi:MAG: chorismate synthase [Candidatus Firestonebacteria bacterium]
MRFLTAGESHGKGLIAVIEDMPAGLELTADYINNMLAERQKGYGRGQRMSIEKDEVEILSGVRNGKTIGSPISLYIKNRDWENWKDIMKVKAGVSTPGIKLPRPGHADLCGILKYGFNDIRNVIERASARETAIRVAVGACAKRLLEEFQIDVLGFVVELGAIKTNIKKMDFLKIKYAISKSKLRCPDKNSEIKMIKKIDLAKKKGDTLGGIFEIRAINVPLGLGTYSQWDERLNAKLSYALMSIPAVKGVEIGLGFDYAKNFGSAVHDKIFYKNSRGYYRLTNNAGGIEGGISNGEEIILKAVMKPIATLRKPLSSVNIDTKKKSIAHIERSDVTAVASASVVGEAVVAWTLAQAMNKKFGGDNIREMKENYKHFLRNIAK